MNSEGLGHCPLCGGLKTIVINSVNTPFSVFDLVRCEVCQLTRTFPLPTDESLLEHNIANYYGKDANKFIPVLQKIRNGIMKLRAKYYLSRIPKKIFDFTTRKQSLKSIVKNAYIQKEHTDYQYNEDLFWSLEAKRYYPNFKVSPPDIAVSFSFEVGPRYCFEKNNQTLPFGCHAWTKYDRRFWEPYLLKKPVSPQGIR